MFIDIRVADDSLRDTESLASLSSFWSITWNSFCNSSHWCIFITADGEYGTTSRPTDPDPATGEVPAQSHCMELGTSSGRRSGICFRSTNVAHLKCRTASLLACGWWWSLWARNTALWWWPPSDDLMLVRSKFHCCRSRRTNGRQPKNTKKLRRNFFDMMT